MKLFFTGFLLASHLLAASLHAQFTLRIWNNPGTGDWFSPINWSGGVPTPSDFAYIRNGGTAQITAPGANVRALFLGDLGGVGRLRISGTGFLTAQESIWVGTDGIGEMVLSGGGRALSDGGVVGQSFGGNGAVTVTDPGSRWTLTGFLHVGLGGTGILDIRNNAVVLSNDDILLGHDGSGIVQVRDNGSSLEAAHLAVGFHGSAYLEISNGGYVNSSNSSIAVAGSPPALGQAATALVTGAGSRWDAGALTMGSTFGHRAKLRIENGGTVNTSELILRPGAELELGSNPTLTGLLRIFGGGAVSTFAPVALSNAVELNSGNLQIINNPDGATLHGVISGSGGLIKAGLPGVGEGPLTLTANNTYTGATIVDQGALLIRGSLVSATTVNDGGTLLGTGTVAAVQVNGGGVLEAGILDSGFGTLTASAVSFASGGIFRWDFHSGTGAADRLVVSNGGLFLDANSAFVPMDLGNISLTGAQSFTVIDKQSAGFASGNFAGFAEGTRFDLGANRFAISYRGGDGNDVTLTTIVPLVWDSGGASDQWSDGDNWAANQAPVNGDSLVFGSGVRTNTVMDFPALSVDDVSFIAGAPAFTIHVAEAGAQPQLTINGDLTNASGIEQTLVADGASGPGNSGVVTIASNIMTGPFALIARGPTGAGPNGGVIQFFGAADGITARVITEPGSYFEFGARLGSLRLGSIEGGGLVLMGGNPLLVGFNNLDTEFSGTLAGGALARLEKHGTGRLILSESNTYGGGTFVSGGILEVRAPANGLGLGNAFIQGGSELVFSHSAVGDFQTISA